MIKVGVFDSGVGGKSVANAISKALPQVEVKFVNDTAHVPYGTKTPDQLYELVLPILQELATDCEVIVIACNTVTTTIVGRLREALSVPLVAVEPMVKPAAQKTKTGVIAVCATPTTLASPRYQELKKLYAQGITVVEPDCKDWTEMIESNQIDRQHIRERIQAACQQGADVIVLGCTHYHWIEDEIRQVAGEGVTVMQPEEALIRRLKTVLTEELGQQL